MRTMHPCLCKGLSLLLAALLAGSGAGCSTFREHSVTCKLWDGSREHSYCRSDSDPQLKLFASTNSADFLVEYDAVSGRQKGVRRVAFFLHASRSRLDHGKLPHFVDVRHDANLVPIAIVPALSEARSHGLTNTVFAVNHASSFTLYQPENEPEECALPHAPDGTPWVAAALTPFAVAVDTSIVATTVGVVGGALAVIALCECNYTWRP